MGTMTFTTTGAQDARIVVAFGKYLGLPGNATPAQVKAEVFNFIRLLVVAEEKKAADAAALAAVTPPPDLGQPT